MVGAILGGANPLVISIVSQEVSLIIFDVSATTVGASPTSGFVGVELASNRRRLNQTAEVAALALIENRMYSQREFAVGGLMCHHRVLKLEELFGTCAYGHVLPDKTTVQDRTDGVGEAINERGISKGDNSSR